MINWEERVSKLSDPISCTITTTNTTYRAHPASSPMGNRGSFPGDKAAGAWSWPLSSIKCQVKRMRGDIPPIPQYTVMARCSVLKNHRDNFTCYLYVYHIFLQEMWNSTKIFCQYKRVTWSRFQPGTYQIRNRTTNLPTERFHEWLFDRYRTTWLIF
jgi:hypothetical protein